MNTVRIKLSEVDELFDFCNRDARSGRHNRIEVPRRFAINEVAPLVTLPCFHKREICGQSMLEDLRAAVELSSFLAVGDHGAVAGGCEEPADARTAGANPFRKCALRNQ